MCNIRLRGIILMGNHGPEKLCQPAHDDTHLRNLFIHLCHHCLTTIRQTCNLFIDLSHGFSALPRGRRSRETLTDRGVGQRGVMTDQCVMGFTR